MSDKTQKTPKNIAGKYYVDSDCIGCGLCQQIAPDFFILDEESNVAYVHKQPNDNPQTSLCEEALESCPVQAIGDDGD